VDEGHGGYRAGRHHDLYDDDTKWEKVLYYA
jgi:hypothetical protein